MRFQIKMFLSVFCLVLLGLLFMPVQDVAYAQLPQCTCDNSSDSTCADGFRVTFLGQTDNTFTYSICNEGNDPQSDCRPPMALSHADIIIANPSCISYPGSDITTTIIGTDGSTRACDAPTNEDPACNVGNLNDLLIKCDETAGVFTPGAGECVQIEIEIANTPGITVGPSISLNKAGAVCGSGCLLGPSCVGCVPPTTDPPPTNPPPIIRNIPTISQWGMIATAVMIGLFGLLTVRRGFRIQNK
ncbi:MAG: IPTL-CTERM sorting domain-containing protein [Candidatus Dadabacteria bacterium]|nr:IPTL-CTERM sorting domain-containing protein [Candidatus Dadabacteria bacterium]